MTQEYNKVVDYYQVINDNDAKQLDEALEAPAEPSPALQELFTKYPERKKTARINPDSIPVLGTAVVLVTILMVSSFAVSFSGIYEVSAWTGIPKFIQWLPALFIDAAILAYTISLIVFKARGESTWRTLLGLSGFALVSIFANATHTIAYWDGSLSDYRAWMGVVITASAPIAVLLASEEITRLAFKGEK